MFFSLFNAASKTLIWASCGPQINLILRPLRERVRKGERRKRKGEGVNEREEGGNKLSN